MSKRRKRSGKGIAAEVSANVAEVSAASVAGDEVAEGTGERISVVPPENLQAHDEFVRSPVAVLESLRIRVPPVVAAHARRSSLPQPSPL